MTPDDPRHGTAAGFYAHKATDTEPCPPCDRAIYLYRKQWRRTYEQGIRSTVPTTPVAEHIRNLEQAGMTTAAIHEASGLSSSAFFEIRRGKNPRCRRVNAAAILAVEYGVPATLDPKRRVSILGARRRIQALLAIGWTHDEMHKRSGIRTAVKLHSDADTIALSAHHKIAALYDELAMTPGGNTRTQNRARAAGYPPPLAWDDDTIDDPAAQPTGMKEPRYGVGMDEAAILRRMNGDLTVQLRGGEAIEVVRRLTAAGRGPGEIEAITGINASRVLIEQRRAERNKAKRTAEQTSEEAA